jgi:hypothetical protein
VSHKSSTSNVYDVHFQTTSLRRPDAPPFTQPEGRFNLPHPRFFQRKGGPQYIIVSLFMYSICRILSAYIKMNKITPIMPGKQRKQEQFMPAPQVTNSFSLVIFRDGPKERKGIPSHARPQLHIRSHPDLVRRSKPGQIGPSPVGSYVAQQAQANSGNQTERHSSLSLGTRSLSEPMGGPALRQHRPGSSSLCGSSAALPTSMFLTLAY